jgi:hypothetical protein
MIVMSHLSVLLVMLKALGVLSLGDKEADTSE